MLLDNAGFIPLPGPFLPSGQKNPPENTNTWTQHNHELITHQLINQSTNKSINVFPAFCPPFNVAPFIHSFFLFLFFYLHSFSFFVTKTFIFSIPFSFFLLTFCFFFNSMDVNLKASGQTLLLEPSFIHSFFFFLPSLPSVFFLFFVSSHIFLNSSSLFLFSILSFHVPISFHLSSTFFFLCVSPHYFLLFLFFLLFNSSSFFLWTWNPILKYDFAQM